MTPQESKRALRLLTDDAADTIAWTLQRTSGSFESRRFQILETGTAVVGYYSEGSAALASDFYDEARSEAGAAGRFVAEPIILDRVVKVRRGLAWAAEPLAAEDAPAALGRLTEIVRSEVVRPYRDTVTTNRLRDPQSAGWVRVASSSSCGFCKALAARGAVYREASAQFAAHDSCSCTAAPVFKGGELGPEASVMQYMASKRRRTPAERERIREWAAEYETSSL